MTASETAPYLYWLRHLQPEHHLMVGDMAYYLGMSLQQGYPVLPGVVLSTTVFQQFLTSVDWLDPLLADFPDSFLHIDVDNWRQLQAIAQRIQDSIQTQAIAKTYQSLIFEKVQSLDASIVSIYPSLVVQKGSRSFRSNVPSPFCYLPHALLGSVISSTEPTALMKAIRQLWSRFFRAQHLFYWQRMAIPLQQIKLAVVIQPAIPALISGNMIITEPKTEISSVWGLMNGLINGDGSPDRHYLDHRNQSLSQSQMGAKPYAYTYRHQQLLRHIVPNAYVHQPILSSGMVKHLGDLGQGLLNRIGLPLKVEWALHSPLSDRERGCVLPWNEELENGELESGELESEELEREEPGNKRDENRQTVSDRNIWNPETLLQGIQQGSYMLHVTNISIVGPDYAISNPVPAAPLFSTQPIPTQPISTQPISTQPISTQPISAQSRLVGIGASGGQVTASVWIMAQEDIAQIDAQIHECPSNMILVAKNIPPAWANRLQMAKGVISVEGGLTSHGAILARELGIPAVIGVANALTYLNTGDWVVLDGDRGTVTPILPPALHPPELGTLRSSQPDQQAPSLSSPTWADRSSSLLDTQLDIQLNTQKTATQLMVSVSQPSTLDHLKALPLDGVGLIRSELMLASMLNHQPLEAWLEPEEQSRLLQTIYFPLRQFAEAFAPRPIWYRTLDWRSHEFAHKQDQATTTTSNPLLGNHGTLSYQHNPTFFRTELEAVKQIQADGFDSVNLLLPFVRTVEEFQFCHDIIQEMGLLDTGKCQVWIMAEIPSILMLLSDYFEAGVQGIAIGSNDLAQLLLAVDRTDRGMQTAFRQDHPAVLRAIQSIIRTARQGNRPCSLCGDIVSQYPELIELFIRWGVTTFSVNPDAIATTHAEIIRAEKRLFLEWGRDRFLH